MNNSTLQQSKSPVIYTTFNSLQSQTGTQTSTEWGGFCRFIQDVPAYQDKSAQPLIKLGIYQNDSRAGGSELQQIYGLELDYDDGAISPEQAADTLQNAGITGIVCSTYTSTPQYPKWRVFLPLSKPYAAKFRAALVGAVDVILGHVIAPESYTDKQIFFVGRSPGAGYNTIQTTGAALDTLPDLQQLARDYLQQKKAEQIATANVKQQQLQRAKVERNAPGQISVIDAFNDSYDVGAILKNHGYQPKGKKYLPPTSKSGLAGVAILEGDDGRQRAFSHHGSDPLNTGQANDAFDCFAILEHSGDINAALQAAGDLLYSSDGQTLTQHNANAYLLPKITEALTVIQPDSLKTVGKIARACGGLPDGFDLWAGWAGSYGKRQIWQQLQKQKPLKPGFILMMANEKRAAA